MASYSYHVVLSAVCPGFWRPSTAYAIGDVVATNTGGQLSTYTCTVAGTSNTDEAAFPTGLGGALVDGTVTWSYTSPGEAIQLVFAMPATPAKWIASHAYALNDLVLNGTNIYKCTTAGTSAASGGPSTTGANITDGTAHWAYQYALVSLKIKALRVYANAAGETVPPMLMRRWNYALASHGGSQTSNGGSEKIKAYRVDSTSPQAQATADTVAAYTFVQPTGAVGFEAVISSTGDAPGSFVLPNLVINPGECAGLILLNSTGGNRIELQIDCDET